MIFYPAIDGLRAVAVLMVFFFHYRAGLGPSFGFGWMGVDVFFVLSGFLITGILFDTRYDVGRVRNFYARRMLRIFPLYYGIFVVLLLTTPLLHWNWHRSWWLWLTYLGGLPEQLGLIPAGHLTGTLISRVLGWRLTFGHFWSLCVEEQFYLVWPLLVFLIGDRLRLRNLCFAGVICVPILRIAMMFLNPLRYMGTPTLYLGTIFRVDALLLGAAVALMLRGPERQWLLRSARRILTGGLMVWVLVWLTAGTVFHQSFSWNREQPWISAVGYTILDVTAAGVLLMAIQPQTRLFGWLSGRRLRGLGQISYGFYALHEIPHLVYLHFAQVLIGRYTSHTAPLEALIAGMCTYALALLSFRFYESRFLKLKRFFTVQRSSTSRWMGLESPAT